MATVKIWRIQFGSLGNVTCRNDVTGKNIQEAMKNAKDRWRGSIGRLPEEYQIFSAEVIAETDDEDE